MGQINDIEQQESDLEAVKKEILAKGILHRVPYVALNMRLTLYILGRRSICVIADVSKEDQVQGMVKETVEELGELNVHPLCPFQMGGF